MNHREKKDHLDKFKCALLKICPEYFGIPALDGKIHMNERAFAYELYHQLRSLYNEDTYYVNGELRKGLTIMPNYQLDVTIIPDLVIHQHTTTTDNVIAVEIKSNPDVTGPQIIEDLKKLELYTRPGALFLDYHIGILLVINCDFYQKFSKMNISNRQEIFELLNYTRIAIWNVNVPIPYKEDKSTNSLQLKDDCLTIIQSKNEKLKNALPPSR